METKTKIECGLNVKRGLSEEEKQKQTNKPNRMNMRSALTEKKEEDKNKN